jgi:hypothetical protein
MTVNRSAIQRSAEADGHVRHHPLASDDRAASAPRRRKNPANLIFDVLEAQG